MAIPRIQHHALGGRLRLDVDARVRVWNRAAEELYGVAADDVVNREIAIFGIGADGLAIDEDLAILIHMDGQGTSADKEQTWQAVTGAAPAGVAFGWKNFYVKDHPMMSPQQTIATTPQLSMISYQ